MIANPRFAETLSLVPNQRAYDLRLGHAFRDNSAGAVMAAPALDVLSRWVERVSLRIDLLEGREVPATADGLSMDRAWGDAVRNRSTWVSAFETRTLARSARAADRLLRQWCPGGSDSWLNPDFYRWRNHVRSRLREGMQFSPEDWLCHLRSQLERGGDLPLRLPRVIRLDGFVELTLLEQSVLEALRNRGVQVVDAGADASRIGTGAPPAAGAALHAFDSPGEEFRAVAEWALECLHRGKRRVAVVVNGLDLLASQLTRVFDRIVHPRDNACVAFTGDSLYHLADGSRLAGHAVIDDAFLFLRLSLAEKNCRQPFPDISRLLLSPHLAGWPEEQAARARFEARLRGLGRYLLSMQDLETLLRRWELGSQLPQLSVLIGHTGPVGESPDFAQAVLDRLLRLGWPGRAAQSGLPADCVRRFAGLLERVRQFGPESAQEVLTTLTFCCRDTRLTERGGALSPIQLMNPEDVAGLGFDAAWVMNIHDGNWPGRPISNPYLPYEVLKQVPRATPEGMLRYTRKLQGQLDCLAPEMHYSWSHSGDDVPRMASALLATASMPCVTRIPAARWPVVTEARGVMPKLPAGYDGHPYLHVVEDGYGLPIEQGRDGRIPGGSVIFRDQSACPLMAYLLHRLQLRFDPMPGPFADYAYRGRLLHQALYQLFLEQRERPGLPEKSGIERAVDRALEAQHAKYRLTRPGLRAEQQRLRQLLHQWLEFEHQREGFVVLALEEKRHLQVEGRELEVRIDRIDRLHDGRLLIIDYKSGAVTATGWTRERIEEPQLPLYAVLLEGEQSHSVGGLALASVRTGACRMAGIVDDPDAACTTLYSMESRKSAFGRKFSGWDELLGHWKNGITVLSGEIVSGYAANRLYQKKGLLHAGLDAVLRRSEGEAWLLAHGVTGFGPEGDFEDE